jgi:Tol biopolymer transport system component
VVAPVGSYIDRALFWVSDSGTIVYAPATAALQAQLSWVDRQGKLLRTMGAPGQYTGVVRSPNGSKVAVSRLDATSASEKFELWLWDLERGTQTLFWFKSAVRSRAVWSPDGTRLLVAAVDNGPLLLERSINGIQDGRIVYRGNRGQALTPTSWSPDGRFVLFSAGDQKTGSDIWVLTPDSGAVAPLIQTIEGESNAEFSPDGRWIAYNSTESGRNEVYVTAVVSSLPKLTVGGGPWRVSNGGGNSPRWRADGREIFYDGENSLMAAQVSTDSDSRSARLSLCGSGECLVRPATDMVSSMPLAMGGKSWLPGQSPRSGRARH